MKIAVMSDSHDHWKNLEQAIEIANQESCQQLLFAGDLISPFGISVLSNFKGEVHLIWGNNEGEKEGTLEQIKKYPNLHHHEEVYITEIENRKIIMTHYPYKVESVLSSEKFDVAIHGHSHFYRNQKTPSGLIINPGELAGYISGKVTFIILELDDLSIKQITLRNNY